MAMACDSSLTRVSMHVNAGRDNIGSDAIELRWIELIPAGQKQGLPIEIIAVLELAVIDNARLIAQSFQRSPEQGIFDIGPAPAHVRVGAPEKLDVLGSIGRSA